MKLKLPHRLLLIAGLAAVAIGVIWWQLSIPQGRFPRERYDRIRVGMTPAEVASCIGSGPCPTESLPRIFPDGMVNVAWREASQPGLRTEAIIPESIWLLKRVDIWVDDSDVICVGYFQGEVLMKLWGIRMPPWKVKARRLLIRLRGLVGL
jgi:hypothetical protein